MFSGLAVKNPYISRWVSAMLWSPLFFFIFTIFFHFFWGWGWGFYSSLSMHTHFYIHMCVFSEIFMWQIWKPWNFDICIKWNLQIKFRQSSLVFFHYLKKIINFWENAYYNPFYRGNIFLIQIEYCFLKMNIIKV